MLLFGWFAASKRKDFRIHVLFDFQERKNSAKIYKKFFDFPRKKERKTNNALLNSPVN